MISHFFLAALLLGLILGVVAMLAGVERRPRRKSGSPSVGSPLSRENVISASTEISARFHLPIVAPFATAFGAVGYLLTRYSSLGTSGRIIIPVVAGALSAAGVVIMIARWAVPSARRDVPDERYLWQGLPAQVISPIEAAHPGRIALEVDGMRHAVLAVSLTGEAIDQGSDVIIERVEDGTAFVEAWAVVERRL